MQAPKSNINISVPKKENKTKSELFREAFRALKFSRNWTQIRMVGQLTAEKFNIETYDDIEKLAS